MTRREYIREWHARHPLYASWNGMRQAVGIIRGRSRTTAELYAGISMCDEWSGSYVAYESWAMENGWRPGLMVVRVDKTGDFSPENCTLATYGDSMEYRRNALRIGGVRLRDMVGGEPKRGDPDYRRARDRYVKLGYDVESSLAKAVVPVSENPRIARRNREDKESAGT